jgi:hypothetical protein
VSYGCRIVNQASCQLFFLGEGRTVDSSTAIALFTSDTYSCARKRDCASSLDAPFLDPNASTALTSYGSSAQTIRASLFLMEKRHSFAVRCVIITGRRRRNCSNVCPFICFNDENDFLLYSNTF